MMKNCLTELWN